MPGGSASAFACQEAGETAIDDISLVSFSSSLACPRGNRISGVNSSVGYPDEVRPLNPLAPRKEQKYNLIGGLFTIEFPFQQVILCARSTAKQFVAS